MIAYSFVPPQYGGRGGLRLLQSRDGQLLKELENTTRFGNNNSIVADIDGDGKTELVHADQASLTCYELPSCKVCWSYDDGVMFCWGLPGLSNTDKDGRRQIVFGSEYNNADGSSAMIAIDCYGHQLWRSDGHSEDLGSTPVFIADLDGDGRLEAVVGTGNPSGYGRLPDSQPWGDIYVFDSLGKRLQRICLPGWPVNFALCDINGDGLRSSKRAC